MSDWRRAKVGDIASHHPHALATGPFGSAISARHFVDEGVPVIRGSNLSLDVGVRLKDVGLAFLTADKAAEFERSVARRGDLVFTCWGTVGQIGLIDDRAAHDEYIVSNKQMKLTPDPTRVDSTFLYYQLSSPEMVRSVTGQAIGAAVPGFNLGQLKDIEVLLPPLIVQVRIAEVLDSIDDLIENNRRRMQVLEQMARAIYREWFVNFRYPGHEDIPLVDSPLGPIPEGWVIVTVHDICKRIQAGATPRRSEHAFWTSPEFDWYKTGDLTDSILIRSSEQISKLALTQGRAFEPETILMAIYGSPTVGRLGLVSTKSSANQAALGLVADNAVVTTEYLWFVLEGLRGHLNAIAQGAAQQNVSKEKVATTKVPLPPFTLISAFTSSASSPWRLSHGLQREADNLASIRDLLLPKLVTGQIDVSTLDLDALLEDGAA